ncbi:MAG: hypothetical protein M1154_16930 [Gammaproteobacteria bacterium]|nr:hypothetical protein [Gammaproteobacteria bacterium]
MKSNKQHCSLLINSSDTDMLYVLRTASEKGKKSVEDAQKIHLQRLKMIRSHGAVKATLSYGG